MEQLERSPWIKFSRSFFGHLPNIYRGYMHLAGVRVRIPTIAKNEHNPGVMEVMLPVDLGSGIG